MIRRVPKHIAQPPDWAFAMKPGRWYRLSGEVPDLDLPVTPPGTRYLEDNDPARDPALNPPSSSKERLRRLLGRTWIAPWSGRMGFPAHTEAWNSAVYASGLGRAGSMILFGGGHNTYFGSDVHAFDLERREWRRLTTGFVGGRPDDYGEGAVYPDAVYPDGSPLPPHDYDYMQYDPVGNDLLLFKGQTELGPQVKAVPIPHLLNLDTLTWRHGPKHDSAILNSGGFTTWDAKRRILWGHSGDDGGGNAFLGYRPDGRNSDGTYGQWGPLCENKLPGEANHNAMQMHPGADQIIVALHTRDSLAVIDPERSTEPIVLTDSLGPKPSIQPYAAMEYSENIGSLVYYSAVDGAAIYAIDWESKARWRKLSSVRSIDPVADAAARTRHPVNRAHTFGRFRVAHFDKVDLAVLVRHVDSPVYGLRLND